MGDARIPIVIGVTGHRGLRDEDRPRLEEAVHGIFAELRQLYPASSLVLLSPLAEGADQLVARVGRAQGVRLVAPLPMPRAEYERQFSTTESQRAFNELLGRAEQWFELAHAEGETAAAGGDQLYAPLGAFVALQCDVLIALWNGLPSRKLGGTAQVVRFMLEGCPHLSTASGLLDTLDLGPVYQVVTPRRGEPTVEGTPFEVRRLYPRDERTGKMLATACRRVLECKDRFNADALRFGPKLAKEIETSAAALLPDTARTCSQAPATFIRQYATADEMAVYFQRKRRRALIALLGLVLLGFGSYQAYGSIFADAPWRFWLVVAYPVLLVLAILQYLLALRREYHDKHLDYRALAEGLRVQFFWRLTGLGDEIPDHYLRRYAGELGWVRNAIRTCDLLAGAERRMTAGASAEQQLAELQSVATHWVTDQQQYFDGAAQRNARNLARAERLALALYLGSAVLTLFAVLLDLLGGAAPLRSSGLLCAAMALALSGAIQGYAEKMALLEQAQHFHQMKILFSRARRKVEALVAENDVAGACALIRELGKEALAENGDWLLLHRSRPMQVPKA